ncbi:MAG: hypothetical protein A2Y77_09345 [Planctomycetes bacterium RBG_13_62_9]|nr:MAG: hypothetical protein A2Y77_09345 [Planctomycetes bacterium RBG_13_62_9]
MAILAVGLLLGSLLILWGLPWGTRYLQRQGPETTLRVVQVVIAVVFLGLVPFSAYLYRYGRRAVRSRRMPPPGTRVVRDTRVFEGDAAVARGRLAMAMAGILLVLSLVGGLYFPYRLGKLFRDRQSRPRSTTPVESTDGN